MPPQGQGPTEARPLVMTASVRAPQRWQRISATAGISILPLILMFPSRALTPALGNLAAERVQLPGANVCKLTRFRSGEGPKWPLRAGMGGLCRHGGSRDREGRGGGRPGALLVRRLRLSADAPAHRRRSPLCRVAPGPRAYPGARAGRARFSVPVPWRGARPRGRAQPNRPTAGAGLPRGRGRRPRRLPRAARPRALRADPACVPRTSRGGRSFVRRRYGLIGWHPHARVMGDLPPEARHEPAGPAPKGRQATARQPRPSRTQPWVPGLI
jgi:hypothetical protein